MGIAEAEKKRRKQSLCYYILVSSIAALCVVFSMEQTGIGDSDFYWHITLGKYILQNRIIPEQDIFSWLAPEYGLQLTAHSWLGSVVLYLCSTLFQRVEYAVFLYVGISAFLYAVFLLLVWGRKVKDPVEGALFAVCFTVPLSWAGRPQNIGMLLFAVAYWLLQDAYENRDSIKWMALPLVSILWANLHGGSVPILFAFNGLFLVMSLLPSFNVGVLTNDGGRKRQRIKRFAGLLVADVIAALANPYGYKLFVYFFVTNNENTKRYVAEWAPAGVVQPMVFSSILILLIIFAGRFKVKVCYLLPIAACFIMTAMHVRIANYLFMTLTPLAYQTITVTLAVRDEKLKHAYGYSSKRFAAKTMRGMLCLVLAGAVFVGVNAVVSVNDVERQYDKMTPEFVESLKQIGPKRMYTSYDDGGLVIYHGMKSFIDSRADPFPDDILEKGLLFNFLFLVTCDYDIYNGRMVLAAVENR